MKASSILSRSSRAFLAGSRPRPSGVRPMLPLALRPLALRPARNLVSPFSSTPSAPSPRVTDEPRAPNPEPQNSSGGAAQISDAEYHEIADEYLNSLLLALEDKAESSDDGLEVEFAAGVLTITHPKGTYVVNKQPPNKQIWLSSPVSGPKRYDWVVTGAGQHEKEDSVADAGDDGRGGKWIYLRDGSSLSDLLKKEVGAVIIPEDESDDIVVVSSRSGADGGAAKLE